MCVLRHYCLNDFWENVLKTGQTYLLFLQSTKLIGVMHLFLTYSNLKFNCIFMKNI